MSKNELYSFFEEEKDALQSRPIDIFNMLSQKYSLQNISLDERNFYLKIISSFQKNYNFMLNL